MNSRDSDIRYSSRTRIAFLLSMLLCTVADGDGKYWPEKAHEKAPGIPQQRALVIFKDNHETLIIESSADSESKSLGWIVPLPAPPTTMRVVRPGIFESLGMLLGPRITHDIWSQVKAVGYVCALVLCFTVALLWRRRVWDALVLLLILLLFSGLMLPSLATAGRSSPMDAAGIDILDSQRIGSYDVSVLRAQGTDALQTWLTSNGFASLSGEEKRIAGEYIRQSWCFFAARIVRTEAGDVTPHPIFLKFPATKAVYPMKLTALAGADTAFDIYTIGDSQAVCPQLRTALADRFVLSRNEPSYGPSMNTWMAQNTGVSIGHLDLNPLMWDGCVITRFRGSLTPAEMQTDLTFGWMPLRPYREHFYSSKGARYTATIAAMVIGAIGLIGVVCVFRKEFGMELERTRAGLWIGAVIAASAAIGLVVYLALPVRAVTTGHHAIRWLRGRQIPVALHMILTERLTSDTPTANEVRALIRDWLKSDWDEYHSADPQNPYTGEAMTEMASPGNYEVRDESGITNVYYVDRLARHMLVWSSDLKESGDVGP